MKTITLISLVTLSLIYATAQNSNDLEYEHQLKSPSSVESPLEDMSEMKAMGKCGADQKGSKPTTHHDPLAGVEASSELEHAVKTPPSEESPAEDMSKMKAMGKCGADQKADKPVVKYDKKVSQTELEYEHNLRLPTSEEDIGKDMGNMKAMGKCGSDK